MKERLTPQRSFQYISVYDLRLDPQNPRLPEGAAEWSMSRVVEHFQEHSPIDELIQSMLSHGFFQQEPLIILAEPDPTTDQYIVVEGNRRLASLLYLFGEVEGRYLEEEPTTQQLERLEEIPCVVVASRDEVRTYLGFRHIGGVKDWSPEAKARFVSAEVDRLHCSGDRSPFSAVARSYGSNTQGVRNAYIALTILRYAKSEFGIDVSHVQFERFGVWQRCLNSSAIREYIKFGVPRSYEEIHAALTELDQSRLMQVIGDLTPNRGRRQALVNDSRQITDYGKVLTHPAAHTILREFNDLDAAAQLVRLEDLPSRLEKVASILAGIVEEIDAAPLSDALQVAYETVGRAYRKLRAQMLLKEEDA